MFHEQTKMWLKDHYDVTTSFLSGRMLKSLGLIDAPFPRESGELILQKLYHIFDEQVSLYSRVKLVVDDHTYTSSELTDDMCDDLVSRFVIAKNVTDPGEAELMSVNLTRRFKEFKNQLYYSEKGIVYDINVPFGFKRKSNLYVKDHFDDSLQVDVGSTSRDAGSTSTDALGVLADAVTSSETHRPSRPLFPDEVRRSNRRGGHASSASNDANKRFKP